MFELEGHAILLERVEEFMKAIETTARVTPKGELMARVPRDILPGRHSVILILTGIESEAQRRHRGSFPVDHVGRWPIGLSLRREDLYGDNGR